MARDESFRERLAQAIAEAHDIDSGVDAVMRVIGEGSDEPTCSCPEGPYIGTQEFGEPIKCERCGCLLMGPGHPLDELGRCEWWHDAMERFADAADAKVELKAARAEIE